MGQAKRYGIHNSHLRPIEKIQGCSDLDAVILHTSGSMGNNIIDNGVIGKRGDSSKGVIHSFGGNGYMVIIKRYTAMAEGKMMLFFVDFLGIPIFAYSAFMNLGELKGFILMAIAVAYGIARLWFYIDKQRDESKARKLKIEELEYDIHEKIDDHSDTDSE